MKKKGLLVNRNLWKRLNNIFSAEEPQSVADLAVETKLSQAEFKQMLSILKDLNAPVDIKHMQGRLKIHSHQDEQTIFQYWTWPQWIMINALIEEVAAHSPNKNILELSQQLKAVFNQHPSYQIFDNFKKRLSQWEEKPETKLEIHMNHMVQTIEEALFDQKSLNIFHQLGNQFNVKPFRLIYLEGDLSLIGEEKLDHSLTAIKVKEMSQVLPIEGWISVMTELDVEAFVRGIREMAELEERLVLKIKNPAQFELKPNHHFLAKPYAVMNPEGDLIWSAYVEVGRHLFEWLMTLENSVEILDPLKIKSEFLNYCKDKIKKVA